MTTRQCSGCTLCCKLLPMLASTRSQSFRTAEAMVSAGMMDPRELNRAVPDFDKPAGARCPHQQHHKGCRVYQRRPFACRAWQCRWLAEDDTAELSRPDRSHYVIDIAPDYVTDTQTGRTIPVIQIWCDPDHERAIDDPALRAFLIRRAAEGYAALVRYGSRDAMFLAYVDGLWHEQRRVTRETEHTIADKIEALGPLRVILA